MAKLTFFRQQRYDRAIRTGIRLDDELIYHRFESRSEEPDPGLLWYLDVIFRGDAVPNAPDEAKNWLTTALGVPIRTGLERYAERLGSCEDPDDYPLDWEDFPSAPPGVNIAVSGSAVQRVDAREMEEVIRSIAENWDVIVNGLAAWQPREAGIEQR